MHVVEGCRLFTGVLVPPWAVPVNVGAEAVMGVNVPGANSDEPPPEAIIACPAPAGSPSSLPPLISGALLVPRGVYGGRFAVSSVFVSMPQRHKWPVAADYEPAPDNK